MAKQLFNNFASSLLAASISNSDLTIQVSAGQGSRFPSPTGGDYFLVTLVNALGDREHVKVTSRTGDLLTVPTGGRGQEGTSAQSWTNGQTRVEMRVTKGTLENFLQRTGDSMSGDLDMDGNDVIDAVLSGAGTKMVAGEIVNVPMRGVSGDSSNEVIVPSDGTRAKASGQPILTEADTTFIRNAAIPAGIVAMWSGSAASIPTGWALCDGGGGRPDLRDRFVIGAGGALSPGATGGASSASTSSNGSHSHTGSTTDATVLTVNQLPAHGHDIFAANGSGSSNADYWGGFGVRGIPGEDVGPFGYRTTSQQGDVLIGQTGGGQGHTHGLSGLSTDGAHTHTVSTVPPYYALCYIIKT